MTHYTPTQVRELADSYKFPGNRTAIVLRELADQVEALQADAARYQWLKQWAYVGIGWKDKGVSAWNQEYLNGAIDAAMKEMK